MEKVFDTKVQELKYEVLKEIIKCAYDGDMSGVYTDIPKKIVPGPKASMRCCIYKERAILQERIKLALGGDKNNPNIVEVIDIACDECPIDGIFVTPACRGCIVHRCQNVCPRGAITIVDKKAVVDKEKCIECGKCTQACPYGAIIRQHRPCVVSCKVGAISMDENKKACIDNDKCVACGACVYQCPFGAISGARYNRYSQKIGEQHKVQGLRADCAGNRQPIQVRENRAGSHRHKEARLPSGGGGCSRRGHHAVARGERV